MENIKNTLILLVALGVIAGGYVALKYAEVAGVHELSLNSYKGLPSVYCETTQTDFSGAVQSKVYVHNGKVRLDYGGVLNDQQFHAHIIVLADGTGYKWADGSTRGTSGDFATLTGSKTGKIPLGSCGPWLFPDDALFRAPAAVEFDEA